MAVTGEAAQIVDALLSHCAGLTTGAPMLPVSYPEVSFTPPTNGRYLEVNFVGGPPAWEGLSSGKMDKGQLQIKVVWDRGVGLIQPRQAAQSVADHFAKETRLYSGNVRVVVNREPWVASEIPDDNALLIPVIIPWVAAQISV